MSKKDNFFTETIRIILPYWRSDQKKKAFSMLLACLILNFLFIYISVRVNYWSRDLYDSLEKKSPELFLQVLFSYLPLLFFFLLFFISKNYAESYLAFNWRQWLTENYLKKWTRNSNYYHIISSKNHVDNPDQRISQDLNNFSAGSLSLFITLTSEVVNLVTFGVLLWGLSKMLVISIFGVRIDIPGYLIIVALIYSIIGSGVMILIGKPLVKLDFLQEKFEANFRYSLIRLQERREEIALYDGSFSEQKNLSAKFSDIRANFYQIIKRKIYINICNNLYLNLSSLIPVIAASPMYFAGAITLGTVMQISNAFGQVKNSFSIIVDNFIMLASLRATIIRLRDLNDNIAKSEDELNKKQIINSSANQKNIEIQNLTIKNPAEKILSSKINLNLSDGDKLIIKGPSGAGKSTFIKCLKGLWKHGEGLIRFPENKKTMFVPQKPYMPIASLVDVICYPGKISNKGMRENIINLLEEMDLGHLVKKLNSSKDWTNHLSLGEQQKIAIIRALINNPDILILDEPTTSLDSQSESFIYKKLFESFNKQTIICVSHSDKYDDLFNKKLLISCVKSTA